MPSFTSHLLGLDDRALKEAITHPFLSAAARGSLPQTKLKYWLGQDRLYQLAYVNFIGVMLSRVAIPCSRNRPESLEWRITDLLIDSLTNIRTEMQMFEDTAAQEGFLDEISGIETEVQTRVYRDLFAGATAQGRPLVVGLTVLWATEECYLRAWRFAKGQMSPGLEEADKDVMQKAFIPAWTSDEFGVFVSRIRGVVDELGAGLQEGSTEWTECERALKQVVWAERGFWPCM